MTWRRVLRVLAVLLNIAYIGLWMFQLSQEEAHTMGPEAWRAALSYYALMIAVPVVSLVALLWPPTQT